MPGTAHAKLEIIGMIDCPDRPTKRIAWVRQVLGDVQDKMPVFYSWRTRLTQFLNQPIPGTVGLFLVMAIVFQAVFAWATPMMELIDAATASFGSRVGGLLGGCRID